MKRLRPWFFCLFFFILANVWIESYFSTHGDSIYIEEDLEKRVTYYSEREIRKLLRMIQSDDQPKVVLVGDSFLWGTGVSAQELASEQLKRRLSDEYPNLHIWNVALPASHATDVYAMLKAILPMQPTALIVNTNYYFFTIPEDRNHMTQKWMLPLLEDEEGYAHLLKALGLNRTEMWIKSIMQTIIPVYRHKVELNIQLLGTTNGQDYITGEIAKLYSWLKHRSPIALPPGKVTEKSYREFYNPHIISEDQINVIYAKKIAELLDQSGIPTYLFSTPQNPTVLDSLIENAIFETNMKMIDRIYSGRSFLYENLHGVINPQYQRDNIHLTQEGHTVMADILYDRMKYLLHQRGAGVE